MERICLAAPQKACVIWILKKKGETAKVCEIHTARPKIEIFWTEDTGAFPWSFLKMAEIQPRRATIALCVLFTGFLTQA